MKSDLPRNFKEGDELTASMVNGILGEIWRWRNMEAMPPIHISEADSDAPPFISFFQDKTSQLFAGTTGTFGFTAGTIVTPSSTTVTIYLTELTSGGFTSTTSATAYNIYANAISGSLNAYYWKSPNTGNYYIITADC